MIKLDHFFCGFLVCLLLYVLFHFISQHHGQVFPISAGLPAETRIG
jgi:hypothetical protein